jgi:hypothetical protein
MVSREIPGGWKLVSGTGGGSSARTVGISIRLTKCQTVARVKKRAQIDLANTVRATLIPNRT